MVIYTREIYTSEVMNALVSAGLTYSPEAGDSFPMRKIPCAKVASVIVQFLVEHNIRVYHDIPDSHGVWVYRSFYQTTTE